LSLVLDGGNFSCGDPVDFSWEGLILGFFERASILRNVVISFGGKTSQSLSLGGGVIAELVVSNSEGVGVIRVSLLNELFSGTPVLEAHVEVINGVV